MARTHGLSRTKPHSSPDYRLTRTSTPAHDGRRESRGVRVYPLTADRRRFPTLLRARLGNRTSGLKPSLAVPLQAQARRRVALTDLPRWRPAGRPGSAMTRLTSGVNLMLDAQRAYSKGAQSK